MSEIALKEFQGARSEQLQRNEARNMRKVVSQARGDVNRSGNRWPFELTQNAHDPGPRAGKSEVNISLSFDGQTVVYEHDGRPFTMRDLAALLSGGSNKEFESQETTGRFGTGFLLTHVLAHQIHFTGILGVSGGFEQFTLQLDRSGKEEEIYANTVSSYQDIAKAATIVDLESQKTAQFRYVTDNRDAALLGLKYFSNAVPYLFATCEHLGQVEIKNENQKKQTFCPKPETTFEYNGIQIRERLVVVSTEGEASSKIYRALRFRKVMDSAASLVIVVEQENSFWRVNPLTSDSPKFFCRFPIRASNFLPANVVIDGRFDLSVERDSISMNEQGKEQITEALSLLPSLVQMAIHENWLNDFKLARLGMPELVFGDHLDEAAKLWWKSTLSSVAHKLAQMQIVRTADGELHRVADSVAEADFVIPCFDSSQPTDELEFENVWESASEISDALPPKLEIAREWTQITREWQALDVKSQRLTLSKMADLVRSGVVKLEALKTTVAPLKWLANFLNLIGKLVQKHNCSNLLTGLIPDQNGKLSAPINLRRDAGVEEPLKDIALRIKRDVRSRLLSNDLLACSAEPDFPNLRLLLETHIPQTLTSHAVIEECLQELSKQLPDSRAISPESQILSDAAIDFLLFLWKTRGEQASELAKKCPLIASDGTAVRWSPQRKVMAPVLHWHADAQPFAELYKRDRVLSGEYLSRFSGDKVLVEAMIVWDMAFPDPLTKDKPKELPLERIKSILVPGQSEEIIVNEVELSQIALLPSELIQRCQGSEVMAKLLLGLVLNYVVRRDMTWQHSISVAARINRDSLTVNLFPALWIADLKSKSWVPLRVEAGWSQVLADAGTLKGLLNKAWLEGNDPAIRLLVHFFGYKELELRLMAMATTEELLKQMESGLSKIVQTLGSDAVKYTDLADALEKKKLQEEEKQRNRKFGLAVQEAIRQCLESKNIFNLELVDCGYDYDVFLDDQDSIDAGTHHFKMANYILEVKATTSGEVRLTPTQAATASTEHDRFILCVVDLRGISHTRMEEAWVAADVEPNVKILKQVGVKTRRPHTLVEEAKECDVGIRNDGALRYGVPVPVWQNGISIADWIAELTVLLPPHVEDIS